MPFSWSVHPSIPIGVALLLGVYAALIGPLRPRLAWGPPVPPKKVAAFVSAVFILFLALTGPIHDLSDSYLFTVHMLQHLILTLVVPPLLLIGTPDWLVRRCLAPAPLGGLARTLGSAPVAYVIFNGMLAVWHLEPLYNMTLFRLDVHILQHLLFLAAAVIGWWPILAPAPEYRSSMIVQMLYLLFAPFPMKIVGILITMSDRVLYPAYAIAPRVFNLDPLTDQQIGGLIMWVPAGFVFWIALAAHFFRWYGESRRQDAGETKVVPLARERVI